MSFLSGLKKVGKVALKVAPYAAMAIPGIGIPASMAIQAGLGAANAKAGGAGWKGTLLGAGIGAGTGAVSGGLGSTAKGLAPSQSFVKGAVEGTAGKALGKGLGSKALEYGTTVAGNALGTGSSKTEIAKGILGRIGSPAAQNGIPSPNGASGVDTMPRPGAMPSPSDQYPGGFGPNFGEDQNNPNLANSINQGKLDAQKYRRPSILSSLPPMQDSRRAYGY